MNQAPLRRALGLHNVPPHILVFTALASYAGQALAALLGWPLWAVVLTTLLPWLPVFTHQIVWTYRHYQWLALFYLLVVTQAGHFLEHVAQMTQLHVLGLEGAEAHGIFGALDIEWVHFIWNTWIIVAVLLLSFRFRTNPWLWLTLLIAAWHEIEHAYILSVYLSTGRAGTPGFLAEGGAIGGGLPVVRPDLHFVYNLVETALLVIAFIYQLKRTHDEWLARAFPHLSTQLLLETTTRAQTLRFAAGETVARQGDPADRFYIITRGEATVTRQDQVGQEVQVAALRPGECFGEIGLLAHAPYNASVRARTAIEVLALDREMFRLVVENSTATDKNLARGVPQRLDSASL